MIQMDRDWANGYLGGINQASVQVFSPPRSVVTDMIMVQFISMIVIFGLVLLLKGGQLTTIEGETAFALMKHPHFLHTSSAFRR